MINHSDSAYQRNSRFDDVSMWKNRWASLEGQITVLSKAIWDERDQVQQFVEGDDEWYGRSLLEEVFGEQTVEEQWSQIQLKPLATWLRTIYSWLYEADRFMKLGVALGFMGNTLEELKTLLLEKGA
ncbi:hypothetical protein KFU94_61535, partial [Chloroflexi bacterium TSY]|nr:hypothetical protein [Chloroflexi bacterium TSY]